MDMWFNSDICWCAIVIYAGVLIVKLVKELIVFGT